MIHDILVYNLTFELHNNSQSQLIPESEKSILDTHRDPANHALKSAYSLLLSDFGPYQPNDCDFPKTNGRQFRKQWYNTHSWLEYSTTSNSAYCFYCRVFPSLNNEVAFVSNGFKAWHKATKSFISHKYII